MTIAYCKLSAIACCSRNQLFCLYDRRIGNADEVMARQLYIVMYSQLIVWARQISRRMLIGTCRRRTAFAYANANQFERGYYVYEHMQEVGRWAPSRSKHMPTRTICWSRRQCSPGPRIGPTGQCSPGQHMKPSATFKLDWPYLGL